MYIRRITYILQLVEYGDSEGNHTKVGHGDREGNLYIGKIRIYEG